MGLFLIDLESITFVLEADPPALVYFLKWVH